LWSSIAFGEFDARYTVRSIGTGFLNPKPDGSTKIPKQIRCGAPVTVGAEEVGYHIIPQHVLEAQRCHTAQNV